ncbi:MAG: hypothetical protein WDO19_17015 [Bacteroidota bacterium]
MESKEIIQLIDKFQKFMSAHLPELESQVDSIIRKQEKDVKTIEHLLDSLVSLTTAGIGESLFIRLLNYYKTVDEKAAIDYWKIFEEMNE